MRGKSIFCPKDKSGLGYIVWQMIQDKEISIKQASVSLDMSYAHLYDLLNSKRPISQTWILQRDLVQKLQNLYPAGWAKYGAKFSEKLSLLPSGPVRKTPQQKVSEQKLPENPYRLSKKDYGDIRVTRMLPQERPFWTILKYATA